MHNEAQNISKVLRWIRVHDQAANICVIDSACEDESVALVKGYGVHVLPAPKGYTEALACGYRYAYTQGWKSLVQLDGDGQHHPMYARGLHNKLSEADWVIASRHETGSAGNIGVRTISWFGTKFFLSDILHDPSSGYWALNELMIERFAALFPVPYTELPLRMMLRHSTRICECGVPMSHREQGESMHAGWKGVVHGIRMMIYGWSIQKN